MERTFTAPTVGPPETVLAVVSDLSTYPRWLDVVSAVEPDPDGGDGPPAWIVTLTAKVGPFARSKRLRMVRTEYVDDGGHGTVRFERSELDGRDHAAWVMNAAVADDATATVTLAYDGSMWSGLLDGVLDAAAGRAARRLADTVAAESTAAGPA